MKYMMSTDELKKLPVIKGAKTDAVQEAAKRLKLEPAAYKASKTAVWGTVAGWLRGRRRRGTMGASRLY
jgi:hypothetical protein